MVRSISCAFHLGWWTTFPHPLCSPATVSSGTKTRILSASSTRTARPPFSTTTSLQFSLPHLQIAFTILYHKNTDNSYRIVGVHAAPSSIDYVEHDGKLLSRGVDSLMMLKAPCTVTFTYTVQFEASEIDYGSRWDIYLKNSRGKGAHWFSLMNSFCMALFLTVRSMDSLHLQTIAGIIILRTLSRDILMYNSIVSLSLFLAFILDRRRANRHRRRRRLEAHPRRCLPSSRRLRCLRVARRRGRRFSPLPSPLDAGPLHHAHGHRSRRRRRFIAQIPLNLYFGGKKRSSVIIFVGVLLPATIAGVTLVMNIMWFLVGSPQFIHLSGFLSFSLTQPLFSS